MSTSLQPGSLQFVARGNTEIFHYFLRNQLILINRIEVRSIVPSLVYRSDRNSFYDSTVAYPTDSGFLVTLNATFTPMSGHVFATRNVSSDSAS